ncbi:MAG: hypothetical protein IPJ56_17995 [Gemmatimonadetes bacterium]|nr:hypothetical protein [Gemmatimonadota bacterium]
MLAIDADKRVVEDMPAVPTAEVAARITEILTRCGATIRILVDGVAVDAEASKRAAATVIDASDDPRPAAASRMPAQPVQIFEGDQGAQLPGIDLAHMMLWDTYDRAARVQSWMLEQASAFTLDLLNNNKRLADQAGELQKRYQTALAEIDYMAREQKLMESEAAAASLSRHLIEKARAEIAAANPTKPSDWIDDLIDGAAVALGAMCGTRGPKKDSN